MNSREFTASEMSVLYDRNFFVHKIQTDNKINHVFNDLKQTLSPLNRQFSDKIPEVTGILGGKISRGENYEGFPWRAVDYPATFSQEDIFAFRAILIWGRHLSLNFVLQGKYLLPETFQTLDRLRGLENWRIWMNEELWKWEVDAPFCIPVTEYLQNRTTSDLPPFLRLVQPYPLEKIGSLPESAALTWEQLLRWLPPATAY